MSMIEAIKAAISSSAMSTTVVAECSVVFRQEFV